MNITRVLALLPLFVVLAHSFSWEIVVGEGKQLKFYKNRTLIHTEDIPTCNEIYSVTYDPVNFRVMFVDHNRSQFISSFDLTTRKIQILVTKVTRTISNLAYDPLTQLLFWSEDRKIYSISLKPVSCNEAVGENLLVTLDDACTALAVDSCGGYIYWATKQSIQKAAFDGSEKETIIYKKVNYRGSLAIDQQTQKMYWIENVWSGDSALYIEYAELNGNNRKTLYSKNKQVAASSLAISKDFIYWKSYDEKAILQLPKNEHLLEPIVYIITGQYSWNLPRTAANYTILEQTQGTKVCEALKSLIPKAQVINTSDVGQLNVTKVIEESCSACQHYCVQGNCSVSAEGHPECSCKAGYSGERCEVNICYMYCLHGGVCYQNEEEEPVCRCTAEYEGERCDGASSLTGVNAEDATQKILQKLRREAKKVIKEELKRALQFFSYKIDECVTRF